jgi:hypothetical protein
MTRKPGPGRYRLTLPRVCGGKVEVSTQILVCLFGVKCIGPNAFATMANGEEKEYCKN